MWALLAGDVDMIGDLPTDDLFKLKGDKKLYVEETPSVRVVYVALDQFAEPSPGVKGTEKNPMKDKRVREVLSRTPWPWLAGLADRIAVMYAGRIVKTGST